jgi:light-independent protochlorophyllide reductase subunit B
VSVVAPLGASPADIARLPEADFNVVMYPELARSAAEWLKRNFAMPYTSIVPIGVGATAELIAEARELAGLEATPRSTGETLRMPWYSRSVDSTYLTGKRVFIFGDGTHVVAAARIAAREIGFTVAGLGTYSREMAREVRAVAATLGVEALITDDYLEVEARLGELQPELVLGTQMERHIAKRLGIPSAVISAPVHVQDFPARYSPQMGDEGANVIFDTWVHPLTMGLEEHLLALFRDDFEFHEGAEPSHLARSVTPRPTEQASIPQPAMNEEVSTGAPVRAVIADPSEPRIAAKPAWTVEAEKELGKVPFFVRGKARRNTEAFALQNGLMQISVETLYDAKAHYGR